MTSYTFGKSGTLYFMTERDRFTASETEYLKIGIVTGDRDVKKREREHQTGNPRSIYSLENIESAGVQMLETFMHNFYAHYRVKGEWFRVSISDKETMIDEAGHRATELEAYAHALEFAQQVKAGEHNRDGEAQLLEPEAEGFDEYPQELFRMQEKLKSLRHLKAQVADRLLSMRDRRDFPNEILKIATREASESFSVAQAKKLFPDLTSQFVESKISWSHRLIMPEGQTNEPVNLESNPVVEQSEDPFELHSQYLGLWSQIAQVQWSFHVMEADLLYLTGEEPLTLSINGKTVLEWEKKSRAVFNKDAFIELHPNEAAQCQKRSEAKETFGIAEWRAYSR